MGNACRELVPSQPWTDDGYYLEVPGDNLRGWVGRKGDSS